MTRADALEAATRPRANCVTRMKNGYDPFFIARSRRVGVGRQSVGETPQTSYPSLSPPLVRCNASANFACENAKSKRIQPARKARRRQIERREVRARQVFALHLRNIRRHNPGGGGRRLWDRPLR